MSNALRSKSGWLSSLKRFLYELLPARLRFTRIYKAGGWGCAESVSGGGSTLSVTEPIRHAMPELLARFEIKSMLDAPCGDFHWMRELLAVAPGDLSYYGADIVSPLIASIKKYETDRVKFLVADIMTDDLPVTDMIFCRDCFIHLSESDIRKALENFKRSGASYLMTTSFSEIRHNEDIQTGRWRQLNLQLPPFNFPGPVATIDEKGSNGKHLGLWKLKDLPM